MDKKIGIIGIGSMGEVLLRHILKQKIADPEDVYISDPKKSKLDELKEELSINTSNNKETAERSDVLILAVRPQVLEDVLSEIKSSVTEQLVISVAAGVETGFIKRFLSNASVVRVMPNLLYTVGRGSAVYCSGGVDSEGDEEVVKEIFGTSGLCFKLNEDKMDSATAVIGSGPAFVKYLADSFVSGAEKDFSKEDAEKIIIQILKGTADSFNDSSDVATKGGATIEGLKVLEEYKVKEAVSECLKAVKKRAEELKQRE